MSAFPAAMQIRLTTAVHRSGIFRCHWEFVTLILLVAITVAAQWRRASTATTAAPYWLSGH
jgi:hypothetical protein